MVPVYNGKGDKYEGNSYRGICLMKVVGKYMVELINRVKKGTDTLISEEQCGYQKGRGCRSDFCSEAVV